MATIKDVAKLADVSTSTVSRVINDSRYVSPELTKKVKEAIKKLNYHPHPMAQGLSKGESKTIALVVSDIVNPFFPQVARGVEDCIRESEFSVILTNTGEAADQEERSLTLLRMKRVDGFIISPTSEGENNLKSILKNDVPVVCIDRKISAVEVDQVYSDNENGAYKATEHLIEREHENIGIILGFTDIFSFSDRLDGYKEALLDHEIRVNRDYILKSGLRIEDAFAATKAFLTDHPQVTAIFSTNGLITEGVLRYFKKDGVKCPGEIALVGFDDPEWAKSFNPSITSIAQQPYEMGYQAAQLLLEQIERREENRHPRRVILKTELKIRESSGSVK